MLLIWRCYSLGEAGALASGSMRDGSVVNDDPVDRQSRTVTEPAGEKRLQKKPPKHQCFRDFFYPVLCSFADMGAKWEQLEISVLPHSRAAPKLLPRLGISMSYVLSEQIAHQCVACLFFALFQDMHCISIKPGSACQANSWTVRGLSPASNIYVTTVCRRSCRRIPFMFCTMVILSTL